MRHHLRSFASFLPLLVALAVPSCGWRTALDEGFGGGSDGGLRDAGPRDASTDVPRRDTGGTCEDSSDCDDGLVCNGAEACMGGRCVPIGSVGCSDGVACTRDSCVEPGGCAFEPDDAACGPGSRCDPSLGCVPSGGCVRDEECFDGDACNGDDRCDPGGFCVSGPAPSCEDDGISCTVEFCDPAVGCVSFADSALCSPGEICRVAAGGCVRVPCMGDAECGDLDPCNGEETCNRTTGICRAGTFLTCDDGVACTLDTCVPGSGCFSTTSPERCFDGLDNDCNGAADCSDPVCSGRPECGACVPSFPVERACFDFLDDDCDGLVDCIDPDCAATPECGVCASLEFDCANRADDDCDGLFDCVDSDCAADPSCRTCVPTGMTETSCGDGRDDDCDGLFDCGDPDCAGRPGCACVPRSMTETFCRDGIDDDCDTLLDCRDPDCASRPFCTSTCTPVAPNEIGVATCTNGRDDDCDGRSDCSDPDCAPFGPMSECCNGRDDNGDGAVDEFTCFCQSNDDCVGVGTFEQVCWSNTFSVCAPDCRRVGSDSFCSMFFTDLPRCNRATGECAPR